MNKALYYILFGIWYGLSLLPFRIMYCISDFLFLIVYHAVRYRRHVVRNNLVSAFPEKSRQEILKIEHGFYHFFCDYICESIKMASISEKEMAKRMKFENVEELEQSFSEGKSIAYYLGHYCNWEYISSMPRHFHEDVQFAQIYHPLYNKAMDRLFLTNRERFGAKSVAMKNTLRQLMTWHSEGQKTITGFISDQVPKWNSIHHWLQFLNHDTPVFTGTERIARKLGYAVYYGDVYRVSRGHYVCRSVKITDDARNCKEFEITERYMQLLEATIRREPQFWLWSHNRWKRTHEEFNRRFPDEAKRVTMSE
jgi:KDO2-lipid IV(A) lauroyltransferase